DLLRNDLLNTGVVSNMTESMGMVTEVVSGNNGFDWKGKDPNKDESFGTLAVTHEHGKTVGWQFIAGRDFSRTFASDSSGVVMNEALPKIEAVFKKLIPSVPFDYKFADEDYALKFAAEERTGKLAWFFTILAVFISCLGLFGLASFMAEQRTKEIGVRKVLGASIFNLWKMLSKDFVFLVGLSCLIAIPIAWWLLYEWLQQFAYRTEISSWIFAAA